MSYKLLLLLSLFLFSNQQYFLEEKIVDTQGPIFPNDYLEQEINKCEINVLKDVFGLKENICSNPYQSSPHWVGEGCNKLGQCTPYYCGPHSIHQVLTKFGIEDFTEATLAGFAGTTKDGTDHTGLNNCIKTVNAKKGVNIKVEWRNFSSFGSTLKEKFEGIAKIICKPNQDVIIHNYYRNKYGHYETINKIDLTSSKVNVLNSLGNRDGEGYKGYIESRTFSDYASYIAGISQASIMVLTLS